MTGVTNNCIEFECNNKKCSLFSFHQLKKIVRNKIYHLHSIIYTLRKFIYS